MNNPHAEERTYADTNVKLIGYPTKLSLRAEEHVSEWLREFKLIAFASDGAAEPAAHSASVQLVQLADQLKTVYAAEVSEPERERDRALAAGEATVDVQYRVIPDTEAVLLAWTDVIHKVDEFCRDEELLTLARPPELVQFGDWVCDEFLRQLHGEEPRPWTGPVE